MSLLISISAFIDIMNADFSSMITRFSFAISIILLSVLAGICLFIHFYLGKKFDKLRYQVMKRQFGSLYEDLNVKWNPRQSLYFAQYFIWRRILFGMCLVVFHDKAWLQFFIILHLSFANLLFCLQFDAYFFKLNRRVEAFNEVCIVILTYHMMYFSDLVDNPEVRYYVGWSFIGLVCFNLAVNLLLVFKIQL